MKVLSRSIATLAVALAAGCSGSGSAPSVSHVTPPTSGAPASFGKSNASISVLIHSRTAGKRVVSGRKRDYVSPATEGIIASFVDNNATTTTQGYTLAPNAQASATSPATCGATATDGSFSCTLFFNLSSTASPYQSTLTAYDVAQSGTSATPATSGGSVEALSTDTETLTITSNESNTFDFTLHGIVEGFSTSTKYFGVNATPAPSATPFSTTFHALDGDDYLIDAVDGTTSFDYGTQPSGTFTAAPFAASANDEGGCASAACTSLDASSPTTVADPTTETLSFDYNGGGSPGDGTTVMPYYALIGLTGPSGYAGFTSATVGANTYAASAYVVPFFGIVDPLDTKSRVDASDVSFVDSTSSVTLYALQYHLPTGSTGYSIDTSSCGSIASATGPTTLAAGYGASFTLSAGTTPGSCSVTLSDGAGDTSVINVSYTTSGTSATVPCAVPTLAPNARSRKATTTTPCPSQTMTLYENNTNGQTAYVGSCPAATQVADFAQSNPALRNEGTVTTTELANGTIKVHFSVTNLDPNASLNIDATCQYSIGSLQTDANGNGTADLVLPASFDNSMTGFDVGDSNDGVISGSYAI